MAIIESFFLKTIEMSINATIIGLLIILLKKVFKNVPVKLINIIWIFVIILLIVPVCVESEISIQNYIPKIEPNILFVPTEDTETIIVDFQNTMNKSNEKFQIIPIIWLLCTIGLTLKNITLMAKIKNKIDNVMSTDIKTLKIFDECKEKLKIKADIKLVLQNEIKTPVIFGVTSPMLLITEEVENLSEDEIRYIFMHELVHYKKMDTIIYQVINMLKCIHWFNPILLVVFIKIKNDLEYATDEIVVDILKDRKKYCKVLLKISQIGTENYANVVTIYNGRKELERRILMLKNDGKVNGVSIFIVALLVVILGMASTALATSKITENLDIPLIENLTKTYVKPLATGKISSPYLRRIHPITQEEVFHNGIDIAAEEGTKVVSMLDGKVLKASYDTQNGNQVVVEHDGLCTEYNHLSKIIVEVGESVVGGQKIGEVGKTGMATGAHLHFSVINGQGEYVNPLNYIEM